MSGKKMNPEFSPVSTFDKGKKRMEEDLYHEPLKDGEV